MITKKLYFLPMVILTLMGFKIVEPTSNSNIEVPKTISNGVNREAKTNSQQIVKISTNAKKLGITEKDYIRLKKASSSLGYSEDNFFKSILLFKISLDDAKKNSSSDNSILINVILKPYENTDNLLINLRDFIDFLSKLENKQQKIEIISKIFKTNDEQAIIFFGTIQGLNILDQFINTPDNKLNVYY